MRSIFFARILRQQGGPFDLKASQVWLGVVEIQWDYHGYNGITDPNMVV